MRGSHICSPFTLLHPFVCKASHERSTVVVHSLVPRALPSGAQDRVTTFVVHCHPNEH